MPTSQNDWYGGSSVKAKKSSVASVPHVAMDSQLPCFSTIYITGADIMLIVGLCFTQMHIT